MKFGGTSVGSAERMFNVLDIVRGEKQAIVVLSAMSGTTDILVRLASSLLAQDKDKAREMIDNLEMQYMEVVRHFKLSTELNRQGNELVRSHSDFLRSFTIDMFTSNEEKEVLAQGELLSTALFQLLCMEKKVNSELLPALNFMRLNEKGEPDQDYISRHLRRELLKYRNADYYITQGYICRNSFGEIDNLKRGGSDYTATLIGAAVDAEEIQIWTDIDGMHNNDPRYVRNTHPVTELSFEEAAELAYFGAKILHPTCILPAKNRSIAVKLLNSMDPGARGTLITGRKSEEAKIKAIAAKDGIVAINIRSDRMLFAYGFLRAVFEVFEKFRTPIDMITTSEVAVSVTIDDVQYLNRIVEELNEFGTVEVDEGMSIICIVGNLASDQKGLASSIFDAVRDIPIRMISYGGSRHNISILVRTDLKSATLNALNKGLF